MRTTSTTLTRALIAVAAAVTAVSAPLVARGDSRQTAAAPATAWDTFRADLTIRHAIVGSDGRPAGPGAPSATVRMERRQTGGRWQTTMTLQQIDRPQIRGLTTGPAVDNPFQVVRLEYDEDGSAPRMYDRYGRLARLPRAADRRLLHTPAALAAGLPALDPLPPPANPPGTLLGRDWIDAVLTPPARRNARRAALERQLGPPRGRVRGLDRFLTVAGGAALEVLVDPAAAVPVEVNTTRQGVLVARATFAEVRDAAGALVRRTSRSERPLADPNGERSVTTTELSNIQLSTGGSR